MARKAKRWDEKQMSQLKAQKDKLQEEIRDLQKKSRKESELNTLQSSIAGLQTRLKYSRSDLETTQQAVRYTETWQLYFLPIGISN